MKTTEFKGLIEQLGELTDVQRTALMAALNSKGSANEAIALIETRFAAAPACGHCKSERFGTWGWASGLRRYKCKECKRTFNALTGTPLAWVVQTWSWRAGFVALAAGAATVVVDGTPRGLAPVTLELSPGPHRVALRSVKGTAERAIRVAAGDDVDFTTQLNPESLVVVPGAKIEPSVAQDTAGTRYQFERTGYFWADPIDSKPGALVFNRIVTLRDGWAKVAGVSATGGTGTATAKGDKGR